MSVDKLFVATKAFITYQDKVLLLRESDKYEDGVNVGKYDVPGGRVEPGQRFDESLLREIKEETGLEVEMGCPFHTAEWRPEVRGEKWQIVGTFFECDAQTSEVRLSQDHDHYVWADPQDVSKYNLINGLKEAFDVYIQLREHRKI